MNYESEKIKIKAKQITLCIYRQNKDNSTTTHHVPAWLKGTTSGKQKGTGRKKNSIVNQHEKPNFNAIIKHMPADLQHTYSKFKKKDL